MTRKTVLVKFLNYYKNYAFTTSLPLKEGKIYNIRTAEKNYSTPVYIDSYTNEKYSFELKDIIDAEEVIYED